MIAAAELLDGLPGLRHRGLSSTEERHHVAGEGSLSQHRVQVDDDVTDYCAHALPGVRADGDQFHAAPSLTCEGLRPASGTQCSGANVTCTSCPIPSGVPIGRYTRSESPPTSTIASLRSPKYVVRLIRPRRRLCASGTGRLAAHAVQNWGRTATRIVSPPRPVPWIRISCPPPVSPTS